jgi:hypothetical protein
LIEVLPHVAGLEVFASVSSDDSAAIALHTARDSLFVGRKEDTTLGVGLFS